MSDYDQIIADELLQINKNTKRIADALERMLHDKEIIKEAKKVIDVLKDEDRDLEKIAKRSAAGKLAKHGIITKEKVEPKKDGLYITEDINHGHPPIKPFKESKPKPKKFTWFAVIDGDGKYAAKVRVCDSPNCGYYLRYQTELKTYHHGIYDEVKQTWIFDHERCNFYDS